MCRSKLSYVGLVLFLFVAAGGCERMLMNPSASFPAGEEKIEIPLQRAAHLLLAPVKINGQDAGLFAVDTGAQVTVIDSSLARRFALPRLGGMQFKGIAGYGKANLRLLPLLEVGPIKQRSTAVAEIDLSKLDEKLLGKKITGILGGGLLRHRPFTVDYAKPSITFHDPRTFQQPAPNFEVPMRVETNLPYVRAEAEGMKSEWTVVHTTGSLASPNDQWFLIDTGASLGGLKDVSFFFRPREEGRPIITLRGLGGSGHIEASVVHVPSFRTLNREFKDKLLTETKVSLFLFADEGLIGSTTLENFRLTFDYANARLWAEPAEPEPVEQIASQGRLNEADLFGYTPLIRAAVMGWTSRARKLLEAGADMSAKDIYGQTALHWAAGLGRLEIARLLLGRGADVNARSEDGQTALVAACVHGDARLVEEILAAGARPDQPDDDGFTPLRRAAECGHAAVVKVLLEAGADPEAKSKGRQEAPIYAASGYGFAKTLGALLEGGAKVDSRNKWKQTPLMIAAANGNWKLGEDLIKARADVNAADVDDETPLMHAAGNGHTEAIRLLLLNGADLRAANKNRYTPLILTAIAKEERCCFDAYGFRTSQSDDLVRLFLTESAETIQKTRSDTDDLGGAQRWRIREWQWDIRALPETLEKGLAPRLVALLRWKGQVDEVARKTLCYAIGSTGEKRAIPHLVELLADKQIAADALYALCRLTGQQPENYGLVIKVRSEDNGDDVTRRASFRSTWQKLFAPGRFRRWWAKHKTDPQYKDLKPLELPLMPEVKKDK
jgi:ankyrin repeat protein